VEYLQRESNKSGAMADIHKILEKSNYQSFDFLGEKRRGSNSGKKYELSKIDTYNLEGKSCLDVGCNAGYFLFRLLDKNPELLVGIDAGEVYVDIAKGVNENHFKSDKISFICGDFFFTNFQRTFDLIICFSTFHYFLDKQKDFLDRCYELLNDRGNLLLEIEEYPKNDVPEVNHEPRPLDPQKTRLDYPNNLQIQEWIRDKFVIIDTYPSVKQTGSVYDRFFYKLRKKYPILPGNRALEGNYEKTVIIVTGASRIGKSTLCSELLKEGIDYISADEVCVYDWHGIQEIYDLMNSWKPENTPIGLDEFSGRMFVNYLFNKHIRESKCSNILVDGYLFMMRPVLDYFMEKCRTSGVRVWKTERLV
jgi:SAM-dependent methyltransferase